MKNQITERKWYSKDARETIINYVLLKGKGEKTYAEIFELWGTPRSTIRAWMKNYRDRNGKVDAKIPTGRPKKFTQ